MLQKYLNVRRKLQGAGETTRLKQVMTSENSESSWVPGGQARRRGPFRAGEWVQLTDEKGRMHTTVLQEKGYFQCHQGSIRHSSIIGRPEGSVIDSIEGRHQFTALRPLMVDYHLSMPRGAQIVYPKDAAQIVTEGDIFPGARVVEAGVGSGALSMSLLGAIGPAGELLSVERRPEFAEIAQANVELWFSGKVPNWRIALGDLSEVLEEQVEDHTIDRVVLDMLAPWENIGQAARVLVPGGVLICYIATVTQMARLVEEVRAYQCFTALRSWEVMSRPWHVDGLAVRPDHRMVAHTGFLFTARRLAPGTAPIRKGEGPESVENPEDAVWMRPGAQWQPEQVGERLVSPKKLRKVGRDVRGRAGRVLGEAGSFADSAAQDLPLEGGGEGNDAAGGTVSGGADSSGQA